MRQILVDGPVTSTAVKLIATVLILGIVLGLVVGWTMFYLVTGFLDWALSP